MNTPVAIQRLRGIIAYASRDLSYVVKIEKI